MIYARPKIPPTRYDSKVVSIDDSAAKARARLHSEPRAGRSIGHGAGLGHGVCGQLRGGQPRSRSREGRSGAQARRPTYPSRTLQRRAAELIADPKGGCPGGRRPRRGRGFRLGETASIERTYTTSTVMHFALEPVNALAFEKDGIFEIHTGNQWQTLILPVLAKALGRSQDKIVLRTLSARWRIRSAPRWRLRGAGCARRQGRRQAGQDGLHASRRHALRLSAIAFGAGPAHGLRRWGPGDGNGSPGGGRLAHGGHGPVVHAEGCPRRSVRSVRHPRRRSLVHGGSAAGSRDAQRSGRADISARLVALGRGGLE